VTERQIRLFGDPVLRSRTDPIVVTAGDPKLAALAEDLVDSVTPDGRAGVAANQIGVSLRAFSFNIDGDIGYVFNPVLEVSGDP
jgi:peptide deformylase